MNISKKCKTLKATRLSEAKTTKKLWGGEVEIVNDPAAGYCGKILILHDKARGSKHFHPIKDETMLVLAGRLALELSECTLLMDPGDFYRLPAGVVHRFRALTPMAVIIEFSTPHADDDVVRLEDSQELEPQNGP